MKEYTQKKLKCLGGMLLICLWYCDAAWSALPKAFVDTKEIKSKNVFDIFRSNINSTFTLFGTVVGAYVVFKTAITVYEKYAEVKKTNEWGEFITTATFGLLALVFALGMIVVANEYLSS